MTSRRTPRTVRMRDGSEAGAAGRGWAQGRPQTQDSTWEDDWHQAGDEDFGLGFGRGVDDAFDGRAAGWPPDAAYDPRQRTELIDPAAYGGGFHDGGTDPCAQPVVVAYPEGQARDWPSERRPGRIRNPGVGARRGGRHRHNARSDQEYDGFGSDSQYGPGPDAWDPYAPARSPRATRPARHTPFFSAWRTITLLVVLALALSTALYLHGPAQIRQLFYPLSYQTQIAQASSDHQVSPYLIAAVIQCESGWDPGARSDAGAVGLMQMLPATAQQVAQMGLVDASRYPVSELADPEVNIQYGSAYLRYLVEHYGELEHAIAAYNAGIGTVDDWASAGADIRDEVEYPETSHYLLRVVRSKEAYEQIYPDAFPGWVS